MIVGAVKDENGSERWLLVFSKEQQAGEMAEWLKAHAWKACIPQGIQGSNPCLSAITSKLFGIIAGAGM
jgi:hypothetical protein